ncbi:MAG: HNH endonuclease [Panacagrimonas sp.]
MWINLVVAVTDSDWFETLRRRSDLTEVNFWAPSGTGFKALEPGELFLFKLHSPRNFIVGGGVFAYANQLPCSLAWQAFGEANGASSLREMRGRIAKYRKADPADRVTDFAVGCRILTQPFFLAEPDWIPVPDSWSKNTVTFKTYNTDEADGARLWEAMSVRLMRSVSEGAAEPVTRYGEPRLIAPRLGQGAFRVLVTDIYNRRCTVTQEKTLPALEAAHIRPYAEGGSHLASNGLLLRRDLHSLFDGGYVTVTQDYRFEVSRRIREEFENGKHYYALQGQEIALPARPVDRPDRDALRWHNELCFKG